MDNIVIVSAIIEERRIEKKNTHTHYSQIESSVLTGYGCKTA